MEVAYDGSDFSGWQVQPDRISVQQMIEERLAELYVNQPVRIHSSGRTDSGVHALGQTFTFDPPEKPAIPPENLRKALNHSLPDSIQIRKASFAPDPRFHARYSAIGKAYTYVINCGENLPFSARYSWHLPECRNIREIRKCAERLTGTHDFSSFTTSRKDIDSAVRTIYRIDIDEFGPFLCMTFIGSGFLYKMVRSITGAVVLAGSGKIDSSKIETILKQKDRSAAPKSAPPNGLFLMQVFYDEDSMKAFGLTDIPWYGKSQTD